MSFLSVGQAAEERFAKAITDNLGGYTTPATAEEDINKHIDLFWTKDGNTVSFDVKGLRRNKRTDLSFDDRITWLEVRNVHGNPGWLYGEETYIAFETRDQWVVIQPYRLINLLNRKVLSTSVNRTMPDVPYIYYQRSGRRDVIVKADMEDIKAVANVIFDK